MEDLLYYIGLGAVITISLVRKARKAAAKQAKNSDKGLATDPIPHSQALEKALRELQKSSQPRVESTPTSYTTSQTSTSSPQSAEYHYADEAQSLEIIIDEVALARESSNKRAKTPKKSHKKAQKSPIIESTQQTATAKEKVCTNEQIKKSDDFDLQEAVIYAEILKPKFEEE